jgi:hypothetical protein
MFGCEGQPPRVGRQKRRLLMIHRKHFKGGFIADDQDADDGDEEEQKVGQVNTERMLMMILVKSKMLFIDRKSNGEMQKQTKVS